MVFGMGWVGWRTNMFLSCLGCAEQNFNGLTSFTPIFWVKVVVTGCYHVSCVLSW